MTPAKYRQARELLGLTQAQLAERLGTRREAINRREHGVHGVSAEAVIALRSLMTADQRQQFDATDCDA